MTERLRAIEDELADAAESQDSFTELTQQLWDDDDWESVVQLYHRFADQAVGFVDYETLVEQLLDHADELDDGAQLSEVLTTIGDLYQEQFDAFDAGIRAYHQAFEAYPQDVTPLQRAQYWSRHQDQWELFVEVCRTELEVTEEHRRQARLAVDIAQIQAEQFGRFDVGHQILDGLENLVDVEPGVSLFRDCYDQEITTEQGIEQALEMAQMGLNDGADDLAAQSFVEAAWLENHRIGGDDEEALRLARRALELDPDHAEAQTLVERLDDDQQQAEQADGEAEPQEDSPDATEEAETSEEAEASEETEQPEEPEEPEERSVEGFFDRIEPFDGSVEEARQALDDEPTNLPALKTVRAELIDQGDMAGLAEVLENCVRYFRKKEGEWEVMTELANLYWLQLSDDDQAEYYFKRLKLLDDQHPDVFKFYEAYYEDEGNWRKLFTLLSGRLDGMEDREEMRVVVERLSDIAEYELQTPEKGIDVWKQFLDRFPDDEDARRRLRRIYEDHGKWNALANLLKQRVRDLADRGEESVDERISLLEDMARIYGMELNLDRMVMKIMGQILDLDPDHPEAFNRLRELYESNRRFKDLAELLADNAERVADRGSIGTAVDRLLEAARIWEERLNNQTEAIPHLERIVELSPQERQVRQRLREIYEKRRDFESLFDLRLQEADLLGGDEQLEELQELLGMAREKLRDPRREVRVLKQLLELDDENLELLDDIEQLCRQLEDWEEVARLLERKADLLDGQEAVDALAAAGGIYRQNVDDIEEAERMWLQVRDLDPERATAFEALSGIYVFQQRYDDLEQLYRGGGELSELYDLLGLIAGQRPDDAPGLHRRRATVAEEDLEEPTLVVEALEQLRDGVEDPDEIRRELVEWYRVIDDLDREIEARTKLLESEDDEDARYDQLLTLADLEEKRQQPESALAWAIRAFELHPDRMEAFERCEALAEESGMLEAFVTAAQEVVEEVEDQPLCDQVHGECARIEWQKLQQYNRAIERFEDLRERHPEDLEILEALDALYEQTEQPDDRMEVLNTHIDLLRDRGAADIDVADQLAKVADVQRRHLGELEAARDTYSKILDLQPEHLGAIRGLKELHRRDEEWMDVVDYLLREVPLAGYDSQQARWDAQFELAEVYLHRLDDRFEALQHYGEVLGENPEYEPALKAVRGLLAEDELARDAAMLLEPIFRDLNQHGPLAEALQARLRVCDDRFEEQEILDELIPLFDEQLEDHEQAFEYARRQFEIDPERDDIWLRFEQIGAKLDKWELIEEMFTVESPLEGQDSPTRYDLLRHLAAIREHQLQQSKRALEAWEELHDYDPFDDAVVEALERLYRKLDRPADLADVLQQRAELVDVTEDRVELLIEAGELLVDPLEDPVEAMDVFREVLSLEPEHAGAVDWLRRLYREQEQWHDLDSLLSQQADQTLEPQLRREYLGEVAQLRYRQMGDRSGAIQILCQLLDDDPGDDEIVEFARQVDAELAEDDGDLDLRRDLARTLEPIYRMRDEYDRLDEVLEVRLQTVDEFEQVELLDELVQLRQKKLSDPEAALDALSQAVVLQPEDEERRAKLLELAVGVDRLEDAVETLEEAADGADSFVALPIWKRLGQLSARKLGDTPRAIDYLDRALALDDTDAEILRQQEELFEATGQSDRLCDNLAEQARYADPQRRRELLRRVATLQEHVLDRPIDAIDTHQQLLEMEPDDLASIEALERLYEGREQYFELAELLQRKTDLVETTEDRLEVLQRRAEIAEDELGDIGQAIDVYRQILQEQPDHPEALAEMDRLLDAEMKWPEWADIARRRLEGPLAGRPEERQQLQLRLASVLTEELYEVEEAVELYRDILQRDRTQEDAVEALETLAQEDSWLEEVAPDLEEVYRRQQRWDDLVQLYQRRSDRAMDPQVAADIDFQRATVLHDRCERVDDALWAFADAWKKQLDEDRYRRALLQLGTEEEAWEVMVEVLDEVLQEVMDPELSQELQLTVAQLYDEMLDEPLEAEEYLRQVLSSRPDHGEAYETLQKILLNEQRWYDLVELYENRHDAVVADDESEAMQLLMSVATIQSEELDDGFSAVDTLQRVRAIDPQHSEATEQLRQLLEQQERWEDLAAFYEQRAADANQPMDRTEARLQLAKLCRGPLGRPGRAIELYGEVLETDPGHDEVVEALEEMFADDSQFRSEAAELLEPIYRSRGDDEAVVEVLQARVDASDQPADREQWLREMLQLLVESVDDPQRAWAVAATLFMRQPADEQVRAQLWELTARADGWEQLAQVYRATLEENLDIHDELRARMQLALSEIYGDRLSDLPRGLEAAEKARRIDPENPEAIDAVERLLERQHAWPDLADFYRELANYAPEEDEKRRWYEKLAALYEDVLDDIDAVVDVYARLLEIAPGHDDYRRAMERILTTTERWYELADIYRQRIAEAADQDVVTENRLELAGVLERELGDVDEAVRQYTQILEEDPGNQDAMRSLEGLRRDLSNDDEDRRTLLLSINEVLLENYDHSKSWRRVDDLLGQQVELLGEPAEKVETLIEKAELLLGVTSDDIERVQALTDLVRAFCLDPTNEGLDETIEVLAEDLEAWQRITPIYLKELEKTDDVDRQGHILTAMARIYEERLGDHESAIAAYQQSVEISAESELAFQKLEELYGELEKWAPLVEILERRLDEIYDGDRQQALRKRIARIYHQRLNRPAEALRLYDEIRREEPAELSHLVVMEQLYEDLQDFEALEELLLDKLQLVDDDTLRTEVFCRLGEIRRDHLDDVEGAISCYRDAVAASEDDTEALDALIDLYRSSQRWPELIDVMVSRRDRTDDVDAANDIDVQIGDILLDEAGEPERAFEHYQSALQRNPDDYSARGSMFRLLDDDRTRREAAEVLTEVYRGDEEWDELEALYQRVIEQSDDPEYVGEQYLNLTRLQSQEIGVEMKAFATLCDAIGDVPEIDAVREKLESLAEKLESTADLVPIYEEVLDKGVDDLEARRQMHLVVGTGYAEGMGAADEAAQHFEEVLEIDEYDRQALSWLDRIYQSQKDWPNLTRILERKIDVVDGEELMQTTYQLGYLREVAYEDHEEALRLYRRVLAEQPDHQGVIQGLERMAEDPGLRAEILELLEPTYRDSGDWAKLARLFELKLEVVEDVDVRADLLNDLATVEFEELDRVHVAFQHWGQALAARPQDGAVQDRLELIAEQMSMIEELVDVYAMVIDELDDPIRRMEIAERGGQLAVEVLESPSDAALFFRAVLEVEPEHEQALEILENVARDEGDDESLAAVLAARVESSFDEAEQIQLYNELASVRLRIQDYEGAVEAFEQLLMLDEETLERLETLAQLYEQTEQWAKRVDILERMLPYHDDELIRQETLVAMGRTCMEKLEDFRQARDYFEQAFEIDETDTQVVRALEDVYENLEDWPSLSSLIDHQLADVDEDDGEERVRLHIRRAELRYQSDGDVDGAIEDYRAALAIRDDHPDVFEALASLYRSEQRWEDLVGLINGRINQIEETDEIVDRYLEMAEIAHEKLGALDRAAEFAMPVLEVDAVHPQALDRLEAIYRDSEDYGGVVEIIDRRINAAEGDEQRQRELLEERARTLHEDAGQLAEAADTYEMLLESSPDDEQLIDTLDEIYRELDDGEGQYELLAHQAERAETEDQRADILLKMADVAGKYLGAEVRMETLEAVREIRGDELEVVEPLLDAYIDADEIDRAEPLLESVIQTLSDERKMKDVVRFLHLRGKLAERRGDDAAAQEAYEEAHRIDSTYIPNLLSLGKFFFDRGQFEDAKKIYQILLLHQMNIDDDADKVDVYFHLGAIREQLGEERGARDMYKRALRVDPDNETVKAAVEALGAGH